MTPRRVGILVLSIAVMAGAGSLAWHRSARSRAPEPCSSSGACEAKIAPSLAADAELPKGKPRLLEFTSEHCSACARMKPVLAAIERRCAAGDDAIVRVRIDEPAGAALAAHFGVGLVPAFVSVDAEGREVERFVGEQPPERLAVAVSEVRGSVCSAM